MATEVIKEIRTFNLIFLGINDWNNPIFKDRDKDLFFGDTNKLWVYNELGENNKNVLTYYKENSDSLEFFGDHFDCEPNGGRASNWVFNIL